MKYKEIELKEVFYAKDTLIDKNMIVWNKDSDICFKKIKAYFTNQPYPVLTSDMQLYKHMAEIPPKLCINSYICTYNELKKFIYDNNIDSLVGIDANMLTKAIKDCVNVGCCIPFDFTDNGVSRISTIPSFLCENGYMIDLKSGAYLNIDKNEFVIPLVPITNVTIETNIDIPGIDIPKIDIKVTDWNICDNSIDSASTDSALK